MQICKDWSLIKKQVAHIQSEIEHVAISPNLVSMLIAAEDHRFGRHPGVDFISICRVVHNSIFYGKIEGASTIAMQLARVLTGRYERTLKRKIAEIYLAVRLTMFVKKEYIPKIYLFIAYFGWRMNGLIQASRRLNLDLSALTEFEAASIVARLKYPEPQKYDQIRLGKIQARTKHILSRTIARSTAAKSYQFHVGNTNGTI